MVRYAGPISWYDWTPRLHSHTGYSIDNPYYQDVTSGRVDNAFYFANISFDVSQIPGGLRVHLVEDDLVGP